jgi:hypothetical protein
MFQLFAKLGSSKPNSLKLTAKGYALECSAYACTYYVIFLQQPQFGQSLFIDEVSRYAPQSEGIFWTSDHPDAETSDTTQQSQQTSKPPVGFKPTIKPLSNVSRGMLLFLCQQPLSARFPIMLLLVL